MVREGFPALWSVWKGVVLNSGAFESWRDWVYYESLWAPESQIHAPICTDTLTFVFKYSSPKFSLCLVILMYTVN